jgi:hypothetical protein
MHHNQRHETPFPHLDTGLTCNGHGRQGWPVACACPRMAAVVVGSRTRAVVPCCLRRITIGSMMMQHADIVAGD